MLQSLRQYPVWASFSMLGVTLLLCWGLNAFFPVTIAVLLLLQLAVAIVALQSGPSLAIPISLIAALSFNFLFTAPRFSLQMSDVTDVINLVVFMLVAGVTSYIAHFYRQQRDELEQTRLRNSILLSVSHDLRTPLATIIGTLTTLQAYMNKLSHTERNELLDSATQESHRLHHYIENLLQATKLQHGSLVINKNTENIIDVINVSISRCHEPGRVKITSIESPTVPVSRALIEQAIFNIIDNALRYSPANTIVTIRVYSQSNNVYIDIKDQGEGIPLKHAHKIFDLFYTTHEDKKSDSGSGLGLAVSNGVIRAHQGEIDVVHSEIGCLMRIRLPVDGGE